MSAPRLGIVEEAINGIRDTDLETDPRDRIGLRFFRAVFDRFESMRDSLAG